MQCPTCHSAVDANARFCPSCGAPLEQPTMMAGDDATRLADDATRLASPKTPTRVTPSARSGATSGSGWLSTSGSIDHGQFNPGTVLDNRYRVIGLLGRGGMGEVYRADDLRLGQQVALKFLPASLAHDPVRLGQFHNEIRTARQVSHPNVCRMYDIGEIGDQLFLTMEYVDGEDLSSLLRRIGRLPEDKALEIARQICAGLAAAHERGVLHRDLKPANIMLDSAGRVRLMDFSLAAVGEVTDIRAGTPAYMAPEQLQGQEVTVRSDVYALGLVLYELFTGKRAFDAKTLNDLLEQHASGTITSPTDYVKTLDPVIERAILRCLDPSPARRPASALAVSAAMPGGDPLAAALAAGETPSPEMVAAAGGEHAALSAGAGTALVAAVIAALVALCLLSDRALLVARVPLSKPAVVLVDRAAEVRKALGYTTATGDTAWGFYTDDAYLAWARRHDAGKTNWAQLATGKPPAMGFWYRTSPDVMVPYDRQSPVTFENPPALRIDMVRLQLDPDGHLLSFAAVPSRRAAESAAPAATNWDVAFSAANLNRAEFTEAAPLLNPATFADERKAWKETAGTTRIEAAASHGKIVMFHVAGPWLQGDDDDSANLQPPQLVRLIGVLLVGSLPFIAALLARRNIRLGRSDRRGAWRVYAVVAGVGFVAWLISPRHVSSLDELDRMFASLGSIVFWGGFVFVVYLALEPEVRRGWPTVLITWSRALSGRIRDPLVGRDLLVGTLAGLLLAILGFAVVLVPPLFGLPSSMPARSDLAPLYGYRWVFWAIARSPSNPLIDGVIVVLILSLVRKGLARWSRSFADGWLRWVPASKALSSAVASTAMTVVVGVALFVIVTKRNSIDSTHPWFDVAFSAVLMTSLIGIVLRFGLFATVATFWAVELAGDQTMTLDSTKLYAGPALLTTLVLAGVAILGFWLARAGEPLFGRNTPQASGVVHQ